MNQLLPQVKDSRVVEVDYSPDKASAAPPPTLPQAVSALQHAVAEMGGCDDVNIEYESQRDRYGQMHVKFRFRAYRR